MFSTQAFVSPLDTASTQGFNMPLNKSLHQCSKDDISQTTPQIVKFFQLFKSIFFLPKTFCTKNCPTLLSADSWGQPFRLLTQVLFSTQSPTLQISAIVEQS
jgi:hypothetical protein